MEGRGVYLPPRGLQSLARHLNPQDSAPVVALLAALRSTPIFCSLSLSVSSRKKILFFFLWTTASLNKRRRADCASLDPPTATNAAKDSANRRQRRSKQARGGGEFPSRSSASSLLAHSRGGDDAGRCGEERNGPEVRPPSCRWVEGEGGPGVFKAKNKQPYQARRSPTGQAQLFNLDGSPDGRGPPCRRSEARVARPVARQSPEARPVCDPA
eukprot:364644-Chlamydomonas_euryale.AAC.2